MRMRELLVSLLAMFVVLLGWSYGFQAANPTDRGASPGDPHERIRCADSILDQATGGCLLATSRPKPGLLFPPPHDGGRDNQTGNRAFVGGGVENLATGRRSTIGGGWRNEARFEYATVMGGSENEARAFATVGGGNRNAAQGSFSTISGGRSNSATGDYSTVTGGEGNQARGQGAAVIGGNSNLTRGDFGFIGGGGGNDADGSHSVVGGGLTNSAEGSYSTVGGGRANRATGDYAVVLGGEDNQAAAQFAIVGGGSRNRATGAYSVVAGGDSNVSSGSYATVPGGEANSAGGDFSFAGGRRAKAEHPGAFVWGDSQDVDKSSSAADEFNVYASGGVRIFSNAAGDTGVQLAPGSGTWTTVSDRNAKENFEPVDGVEVLEHLLGVDISTWNYAAQKDEVRHMGPMAQDFYRAFGLGLGPRTIDTVDADGVALAAIQGLALLLEERDEQIEVLLRSNEELREDLDRHARDLRAALAELGEAK